MILYLKLIAQYKNIYDESKMKLNLENIKQKMFENFM